MQGSNELKEKRESLIVAADAIAAKVKAENRNLTADESKDFDTKMDEADGLIAMIADAEKRESAEAVAAEKRAARLAEARTRMIPAVTPAVSTGENRTASEQRVEKREKVLSEAKIFGSLKNFPNTPEGRYNAWKFGHFCLTVMGQPIGKGQRSLRACKEHGIALVPEYVGEEERAAIGQQENINFAGGYLVPDEFNNDMIVLREKFGVFRQFAKKIPMKSDTSSRPRRRGGLTAYFVGEGAAGTASTKPWDLVSLMAKKVMCLALYSTELNEDAVINIGDDLAGEISYAFSKLEDQCGFLGDGTGTYGGIIGLTGKFRQIAATATPATMATNCPNIIASAAGSWVAGTGVTLANLLAMVAALPQYADSPNCAWYCHRTFFTSVMWGVATALNGNRVPEIVAGTQSMFLGYPVRFCQAMPKAYVSAQFPLFFGDLAMGTDFGDRRETSIAFSNSATIGSTNAFAQDALAIRGTERFDINVHDVGYNKNITPASGIDQTNGPIVALVNT